MDRIRFGRALRALRRRRRWRQVDLGVKAGISQSDVSRIELGQLDAIAIGRLDRLAMAVGARLEVRLLWNGEGLDRLLDADHANLVDSVVRRLERARWEVAIEASFAIRGERGSIDVLGWHPQTCSLLVVEVKSVVPDLGATLMTLDRKARLAPLVARDRGWRNRTVSRILIVGEGTSARRRVEQHEAVFRRAFPVRGWEVDRWLRRPAKAIAGLRFLPITRRAGGTQRLRVRGGSSAPSLRSGRQDAGEPPHSDTGYHPGSG